MTDKIEIGDYVEVDIGMGLGAIGMVVTEQAYRGTFRDGVVNSVSIKPNPVTFRIHFLDGSTHTAFPSECRKLKGKELFKAKLSDDKRIYEI